MGDITKNLSRHEFRCHCGCGLADPHPLLCVGIQQMVDALGAERVLITSGSRCDQHNKELAARGIAAPGSKHRKGRGGYTEAADCVFPGVPLSRVAEAALSIPQFASGGLGVYISKSSPRVHVDVRVDGPARWGYHEGAYLAFEVARQLAKEAVQ